MRKLFSIIGAVLLSIASLHAAVETKSWDFSGMSAWDGETASFDAGTVTAQAWRGVGNWGWLEKGDYDKLVVEVAAHDHPILVKIKVRNSDETDEQLTEVQKEMSASQNSIAFDLTKDVIKWIELDNWSSTDGATFTINAIYAYKTIGQEKTVPVWSGANALGNWEHALYIDAIADAYHGDELIISYTKDSDPQCQIKERSSDKYLSFVGDYLNIESATQSSFLLSNADAVALRSNGLYINGKNMTITGIQLRSHGSLWQGSKAAEDWSGYEEIVSAKLTDLKVGNIICVRLSNLTIDGESQVALYDGSWNAFSPEVNYVFKEGDEAPKVVEFPVTYKMAKQLRGKNLLVRGKNFTMTDIFLKEGTPVNTVAEYLSVSDAGMATLVLPFNVPTLPDGVTAYNLTNDGSEVIMATEVNALEADKPVLIVAAAGEYEFVSEANASDDITGKTDTYTNGALIGTYQTINPLAENDGAGNNNFILQDGTDGVAFYQVKDNSCSVAPYRAYLSCSYPGSTGSSAPARMRLVFPNNAPTGISDVQNQVQSTKIIRDGQLIIVRDNKMYNALGQQL